MGVGPENDYTGGPDHDDGPDAIVYRWAVSSVDNGHDPSPAVNRADWIALLNAATTSMQALEAAMQANHAAMWAWWQGRTSAQRVKLRSAALAARGL